jgi:hypothetical protein
MAGELGVLNLYYGRVNDCGTGEGRFDSNSPYECERKRCLAAAEGIRRNLLPGYEEVKVGTKYAVGSEDEARRLIKFCKREIPTSIPGFVLEICMHDKIMFWRRIILPGFIENDREKLTTILKSSGIVPYVYNLYVGIYEGKDAKRRVKKLLERDRNTALRDALKFCEGPVKNFFES